MKASQWAKRILYTRDRIWKPLTLESSLFLYVREEPGEIRPFWTGSLVAVVLAANSNCYLLPRRIQLRCPWVHLVIYIYRLTHSPTGFAVYREISFRFGDLVKSDEVSLKNDSPSLSFRALSRILYTSALQSNFIVISHNIRIFCFVSHKILLTLTWLHGWSRRLM